MTANHEVNAARDRTTPTSPYDLQGRTTDAPLATLPALPDSPACRAARQVAAEYYPDSLREHCYRSYLWAVAWAQAEGRTFDPELLFVAALLHDLGLVEHFDNHTRPFEVSGGDAAWVLAAGAGWPSPRRRRLVEVIERHMWDECPPDLDLEGYLLGTATEFDILGSDDPPLPTPYLHAVLNAHPRLSLASEFTARLQDQATRKPDSAVAAVMAAGLAQALANHPLDRIALG